MFVDRGLNRRVLAASALLAFVVAGTLGLMIFVVAALRDSAGEAKHGEDVVAAANRLERLALDLETGTRGFVIARQEGFLGPFRAASAAYPEAAHRLERLGREGSVQLRRARTIETEIATYRRTWAESVIATARSRPAVAQRLVSTGIGKRQMDTIRKRFATFIATQQRVTARHTADRDSWGRTGMLVGGVAIGGSLLLILVFGSYVFRLVTSPVRRIAECARRLAAGDLSARVTERGAGEV